MQSVASFSFCGPICQPAQVFRFACEVCNGSEGAVAINSHLFRDTVASDDSVGADVNAREGDPFLGAKGSVVIAPHFDWSPTPEVIDFELIQHQVSRGRHTYYSEGGAQHIWVDLWASPRTEAGRGAEDSADQDRSCLAIFATA